MDQVSGCWSNSAKFGRILAKFGKVVSSSVKARQNLVNSADVGRSWPKFGEGVSRLAYVRPMLAEFEVSLGPGATFSTIVWRNFWTAPDLAGFAGGSFPGCVAIDFSTTSGIFSILAMTGLSTAAGISREIVLFAFFPETSVSGSLRHGWVEDRPCNGSRHGRGARDAAVSGPGVAQPRHFEGQGRRRGGAKRASRAGAMITYAHGRWGIAWSRPGDCTLQGCPWLTRVSVSHIFARQCRALLRPNRGRTQLLARG